MAVIVNMGCSEKSKETRLAKDKESAMLDSELYWAEKFSVVTQKATMICLSKSSHIN